MGMHESARARTRPAQSVISFPPGPAILVHLELAVQSTKVPITENDGEKMFSRFARTDQRYALPSTACNCDIIILPGQFFFSSYDPELVIGHSSNQI